VAAQERRTSNQTLPNIRSLSETHWTTAQKDGLMGLCGAEMEALGYSSDEDYRRDSAIDVADVSSVARV